MPDAVGAESPFAAATDVVAFGDDAFTWSVPDGWQQGRGAWGGLVVAAIVRAAEQAEPDAHRVVRSVSAQIMAPVLVGQHRLDVRPVRVGSSMSTLAVTITNASGDPMAQGVVILGAPRTALSVEDVTLATIGAPTAGVPADAPRVPAGPPSPTFMQHLHMRLIDGIPMSGGAAQTLGWLGYDVPVAHDAASLLALVDGWWPASLPALPDVPRMATVNFTANLLVDPTTVNADDLLVSQTFVSAAREGFTSEHRRLWTADGRLAVDNLQTMVLGA